MPTLHSAELVADDWDGYTKTSFLYSLGMGLALGLRHLRVVFR